MVKRVVWTFRAQQDRKQILSYWRLRNKSSVYSKKLSRLFKEAIKIISDYPQIGKRTDDQQLRIKIVRDYLIIYEVTDETLYILTIWDNRQDPKELEKILS